MAALLSFAPSGGGDDTVGNPHRARISQFELFELKCLNSSFDLTLSTIAATRGIKDA